jgi:hypothetical protein
MENKERTEEKKKKFRTSCSDRIDMVELEKGVKREGVNVSFKNPLG